MTQVSNRSGSAKMPPRQSHHPETSIPDLDRVLARLSDRKQAWSDLELDHRIERLETLRRDFAALTTEWVDASLSAKRIEKGTAPESEEWLGGPFCVLRQLRYLTKSLKQIRAGGAVNLPKPILDRGNQQIAVRGMPYEYADHALFPGIKASIWMEPGVTRENLHQNTARAYREPVEASLCLVLGAGNVSSIAPLDVIYKMFVEKQATILKMNPVNDYLGPIFERAFAPLIDQGWTAVAYGGVSVGAYLCQHESVDEIHVTGSDKTHDAIVFGTGPEAARRKAEGKPLNQKRITSELGNVSPVVVVPDAWSKSDISYQATKLASMLANNAGFNCNATRVILTQREWSQRGDLLGELKRVFAELPPRHAYYPGAEERYQRFLDAHPNAIKVGDTESGELPWTLIEDVPADRHDDIAFNAEAFCSVFAETTLDVSDPATYIDRAVEFLNQHVWGSLNACIIIHPKTLRKPGVRDALERAIRDLRYGTISINLWPALGYALGTTPWGAFPGHADGDIQSGRGIVHNTMMFDRPQKSVIRGPFKIRPVAPWFVNHPNPVPLAKELTRFQARATPWRLINVLRVALFARWIKNT